MGNAAMEEIFVFFFCCARERVREGEGGERESKRGREGEEREGGRER